MHDRSASRRDHVRERVLGEDHRRDQVEVQRAADVVERLALGALAAEAVPGHADEDLGRTEAVDHQRHDPPHRLEVEEVAGDREAVDLARPAPSSRSCRRATTATRAPTDASARAMPSPSPDDAPVTMATRPSSSNASSADIARYTSSSSTAAPANCEL